MLLTFQLAPLHAEGTGGGVPAPEARATCVATPPPFQVLAARPDATLTALFCRDTGWNGADGAHSVRLDAQRVLWWFGDTFIGKVQRGRRLPGTRMVNNTGALQLACGPLRFFYPHLQGQPAAWLVPSALREAPTSLPSEPGQSSPERGQSSPGTPSLEEWYWPGDMACDGRRLLMFAMRIARLPKQAGAPEGFDFQEVTNDLLMVDTLAGAPLSWKPVRWRLPRRLRLGAACLLDGEHVYAYGIFPEAQGFDRPLGLARLHRAMLDKPLPGAWQLWCGAAGWCDAAQARGAPHEAELRSATLDAREAAAVAEARQQRHLRTDATSSAPGAGCEVAALFRDAAPEMSISQVLGIPGYVAVYTPVGLSSDIFVRHAARPEGPWSAPLCVYRCPEPGLLVYGARNHPELAHRPGELVITYNRNTQRFADHFRDASIYRPQAVRVRLGRTVAPAP